MKAEKKVMDFFPVTTTDAVYVNGTNTTIKQAMDNSGDKFCLPCRETKVKEINNTDFTMDYLYKDLRILSNEKVVTITIPDIFLYDSAEFNFSTNWNTNDIVFVSESGAEQFRITNSDGLGTWNVIFIPTRGKFSQLKLTDKFRAF